jgi:hypothetical protein
VQSPAPFLKIGTRGSPLALFQARLVQSLLAKAHGVALEAVEIVVISTSGDRIQDRPLSEVGGKGLFTKEIETALLDGTVDVGVHSTKDVATVLPEGLVLPVFLEREDVRDAFVSCRSAAMSIPACKSSPMGWRMPQCWPAPGSTGWARRIGRARCLIRKNSPRPPPRAPSGLKSARAISGPPA